MALSGHAGRSLKRNASRALLACFVAIVTVNAGTLALSVTDASPSQPGGTPGPDCVYQYITLVFRIYQGLGTITFNGNTYSNGGSVVVGSGCHVGYSISKASISNNYRFFQWVSDAGSFGSSTSQSTTFTPSGSGVHSVAMVIDLPDNVWMTGGGFVASGTGFSRAYGAFQLPTSVSYVQGNGYPSVDILYAWVGIGGYGPDSNLWQAGIRIYTTSGYTQLLAWYDPCQAHGSCDYVPDFTYVTPYLHLGDVISVSLTYSGGYSRFSLCDTSNNHCWSPTSGVAFVPDTSYAQWVLEGSSGNAIPDFGFVAFSGAGTSNYPGLAAPLLHITGLGAKWSCGWWSTCYQFMDSNRGGYDYIPAWTSFVDRYAYVQQ